MSSDSYCELEKLVEGKSDSIEISHQEFNREKLIDALNNILSTFYPDCWTKGYFVNAESDYLVYDLHVHGTNPPEKQALRIMEFTKIFKVLKV